MANTRWYNWRQNNSGGRFKSPGIYLLIEAHSIQEAKAIFMDEYYDNSSDCPCCGARWDKDPEYITPEGYGLYTAMAEIMEGNAYLFLPEYKVPVLFVRWYDGKTSSLSWSKGNG